jgi:hypothetical protein
MLFALTISTLQAILILAVIFGFALLLAKVSGPKETVIEGAKGPTKDDLDKMAENIHGLLELSERVTGWKAAVYGAVGVVLGAAGGLAADWVTTGEMTEGEFIRAGVVLGSALLATVVIITLLEHFKAIDWIVRRRRRAKEKRNAVA